MPRKQYAMEYVVDLVHCGKNILIRKKVGVLL